MLGRQLAGLGQPLADRADRQRRGLDRAERGPAEGLDPLDVQVLPENRAEIGRDLLVTIVGGQCVEQHSPPCVTATDSARLRHRHRRSQRPETRRVLSINDTSTPKNTRQTVRAYIENVLRCVETICKTLSPGR